MLSDPPSIGHQQKDEVQEEQQQQQQAQEDEEEKEEEQEQQQEEEGPIVHDDFADAMVEEAFLWTAGGLERGADESGPDSEAHSGRDSPRRRHRQQQHQHQQHQHHQQQQQTSSETPSPRRRTTSGSASLAATALSQRRRLSAELSVGTLSDVELESHSLTTSSSVSLATPQSSRVNRDGGHHSEAEASKIRSTLSEEVNTSVASLLMAVTSEEASKAAKEVTNSLQQELKRLLRGECQARQKETEELRKDLETLRRELQVEQASSAAAMAELWQLTSRHDAEGKALCQACLSELSQLRAEVQAVQASASGSASTADTQQQQQQQQKLQPHNQQQQHQHYHQQHQQLPPSSSPPAQTETQTQTQTQEAATLNPSGALFSYAALRAERAGDEDFALTSPSLTGSVRDLAQVPSPLLGKDGSWSLTGGNQANIQSSQSLCSSTTAMGQPLAQALSGTPAASAMSFMEVQLQSMKTAVSDQLAELRRELTAFRSAAEGRWGPGQPSLIGRGLSAERDGGASLSKAASKHFSTAYGPPLMEPTQIIADSPRELGLDPQTHIGNNFNSINADVGSHQPQQFQQAQSLNNQNNSSNNSSNNNNSNNNNSHGLTPPAPLQLDPNQTSAGSEGRKRLVSFDPQVIVEEPTMPWSAYVSHEVSLGSTEANEAGVVPGMEEVPEVLTTPLRWEALRHSPSSPELPHCILTDAGTGATTRKDLELTPPVPATIPAPSNWTTTATTMTTTSATTGISTSTAAAATAAAAAAGGSGVAQAHMAKAAPSAHFTQLSSSSPVPEVLSPRLLVGPPLTIGSRPVQIRPPQLPTRLGEDGRPPAQQGSPAQPLFAKVVSGSPMASPRTQSQHTLSPSPSPRPQGQQQQQQQQQLHQRTVVSPSPPRLLSPRQMPSPAASLTAPACSGCYPTGATSPLQPGTVMALPSNLAIASLANFRTQSARSSLNAPSSRGSFGQTSVISTVYRQAAPVAPGSASAPARAASPAANPTMVAMLAPAPGS